MKKLYILLSITMMLLASCESDKANEAAMTTERYLNALANKEKEQVVALSCKEWENSASLEVDGLMSVEGNLKDLSCEVVGKDGDYQLVKCQGSLDLTYDNEIRSIDLSKQTYLMAVEDGQWRVCKYQ